MVAEMNRIENAARVAMVISPRLIDCAKPI